jgi:hypothetical protein
MVARGLLVVRLLLLVGTCSVTGLQEEEERIERLSIFFYSILFDLPAYRPACGALASLGPHVILRVHVDTCDPRLQYGKVRAEVVEMVVVLVCVHGHTDHPESSVRSQAAHVLQ